MMAQAALRQIGGMPIGVRDVHVWQARLTAAPLAIRQYEGTLSADERARADRFHFTRDRIAFVAARGTLRSLLGAYVGIPAAAVRFAYGPQGKPALARGVQPETPVHFNLSHADGLALFAFSSCHPVGIDVESLAREAPLEVADQSFAPEEVRQLRAASPQDQPRAFFQCWTRKEAFIKALALGLSAPIDQFAVQFGPGRRAALTRCASEWGAAPDWCIEDLDVGPGYVAALAIRKAAGDVVPVVRRFACDRAVYGSVNVRSVELPALPDESVQEIR